MKKTHSETTSAADKAIGFEFQYYYFLFRLLNLKTGETVGLEVLDDVHTELANDKQILVQLKHSTQTRADGSGINLTTLDVDLWKTLSNWSKVITDANAGRGEKGEQLKFVRKTDFLLVSNKSDNAKNTFLQTIREFQGGTKDYNELSTYLGSLKDKTTSQDITGYINNTLDIDTEVGKEFFKHVDFDLGTDAIIEKCKLAIKEAKIDESKIELVFSSLDSQIRSDNFITVQNNQKITISFDEFYRKYRKHYDRARNKDLIITSFDGNLPEHLADQKFIKQLIDIKDIPDNDLESMAKYTRYRLQMQNNIDNWYQNGDLTGSEMDAFDAESKVRWDNEYHRIYRNCTEDDKNEKAIELLDLMRKEKLLIASQPLPTDMSNGQYYRLSNVPKIGWKKDWQDKYK